MVLCGLRFDTAEKLLARGLGEGRATARRFSPDAGVRDAHSRPTEPSCRPQGVVAWMFGYVRGLGLTHRRAARQACLRWRSFGACRRYTRKPGEAIRSTRVPSARSDSIGSAMSVWPRVRRPLEAAPTRVG